MTEQTVEELEKDIEAKRNVIKERLNIDDDAFDILIKDTIIQCFTSLKIRIEADDPIFAVLLSQERVMTYYSKLISNALKEVPRDISKSIDRKLREAENITETFNEELATFKAGFENSLKDKVIDLNNTIITSFDKFIEKKQTEIDKTFNNLKLPATIESSNNNQNNLISKLIIIALLIVNVGLTAFSLTKSDDKKNVEVLYQKGLIDGFSEIRKTLNTKDADNVEKIIVQSIDKRLQDTK